MVEHLIRLLKSNYKVATLSRGYGRHTSGFRLAGRADTASTLGDEPFQFYKKFGREVNVAVGEERAIAIPYLLDTHPETEVILLDDAFQHRKVKPSFQILLSDYNNPFYKDFLLPVGRLRESRVGVERADVIIVTKCPPELGGDEMIEIGADIRKYANKPLFFTTVHYGSIIPFGDHPAGFPDKVALVTGIANAKPLALFVAGSFSIVKHFAFPDHHSYTQKDMAMISSFAKEHGAAVITTEKDFAKMDTEEFKVFLSQAPFFYLPIEIEFLKNGKDFDEMVLNAVKNA